MAALLHVPHVNRVAVLATEQQFGIHAVLHHVRRTPLARDDCVLAEMPGEVVREVLWAAVVLPLPFQLEGVVVEHEDPAWPVAVWRAEGIHIDPFGTAMH